MSRSRQRKITFFLVIFFATPSLFAQFYVTTRYADNNGLPSRIVRDVAQDTEGYLWVASNNGLYKFDGKEFHSYFSVLNDTTGLRDNKINTVLAAKDGRIWIATPKGVHIMENDIIKYVTLFKGLSDNSNYIIDLFEDSQENIWLSSYDGFYVIKKKTGEILNLSKYFQQPEYSRTVWGITEDSQGRIWVSGSYVPPLVAEKGTFEFKEIPLIINDATIKTGINPFEYTEYSNGKYLISSGVGLLKGVLDENMNLKVRRFRDEKGSIIANEFIYNTIVDSNCNIWTATWKNGFKKYQLVNGQLEEQKVISKNGLVGMTPFARSIYEDSQKNIWIPNNNGLFKLSQANSKIVVFPPSHLESCLNNPFNVIGMVEDKGGHLWVNTQKKLYRFNKEDILQNKCPTKYLTFSNPYMESARNLLIDSKNRLWVSGKEGLSVSQLNNSYEPSPFTTITVAMGLPHRWSTGIFEENETTFWAGNYTGLVKIDLLNRTYKNPLITTYQNNEDNTESLVNTYTFELEKDAYNNLWIGTFSGLSRLIDPEGEGRFKNYTSGFAQPNKISNNSIKDIFKDRKGRLWIGTQTGLNLYLEETDNFLQFGRKEGLPSEYILSISEDSKGQLWVATTNGVFKAIYNESMQGFVHIEYYTDRNGLADNITNRNTLYIDAQDNIFAGSSKGLSFFKPTKTSITPRKFNLGLTTLESIQKKEQGFVSIKNKITDNTIELSNNENSIQLSYTVLDFNDPEHNQYRHKLLPISDDWIETGENSELNFYNLAPGNYEIILDGSNNQNIWSEAPLHLKIEIRPPFWKSKWAYFMYGILFLGIVRLFYVFRIRKRVRELEQETRLEKALLREREQLRNENAADFHDELGSKVTKISMFLTLAERTLNQQKDPSSWFGKMRENITDLSGSFRDLLWVIDPQKDSLSDTFLRLKDFGEDLFNHTNVMYSTGGYSEELETKMLDPQTKKQVVLIFKEALHNCAKYAESTLVTLTVETHEGFVSICLKDNGKGFNVHRQSKGRGLSNMKTRSEKIGSNLSIVSGENGTAITLYQIPHLRDENHGK